MARRDLTGAVDFAHLEGYAAGDQAVVDEVLAIFREQAEIWVRMLDPSGDLQGWRDGAHTLKGAAMGVGAFAFAKVCAEAETAPPGARAGLLERLRDTLQAALSDIAAYQHEQALQSLKTPAPMPRPD